MAESSAADAFKAAQLRHRKSPELLLTEVVDFSSSSFGTSGTKDRIVRLANPNVDSCASRQYRGPLYGLASHPGFVYVPQALSTRIQTDLAYLALSTYSEKPHATNIDLVPAKVGVEIDDPSDRMWELWKRENSFVSSPSRTSVTRGVAGGVDTEQPCSFGGHQQQNKQSTDETKNGSAFRHKGLKNYNRDKTGCVNERELKPYRTLKKLSWSTMGYQYDWTVRAYREDAKSPMPPPLSRLCRLFAGLCTSVGATKGAAASGDDGCFAYNPSAAIVNYYGVKQIMGGHRDDLELDFTKPVVSISLGLPAVFLLGGAKSRDEPPVAILVRPGDVMLLGGESRLCYHGMARVIPHGVSVPPLAAEIESSRSQFWIDAWDDDFGNGVSSELTAVVPKMDLEAVKSYLSNHRININVRQVLPDGVERIHV